MEYSTAVDKKVGDLIAFSSDVCAFNATGANYTIRAGDTALLMSREVLPYAVEITVFAGNEILYYTESEIYHD